MSDHNWVLENLESYSAGGLNAEERERLEGHLPECPSCSQALQDIRASDEQLHSLFAPVRPKPGFEDRMISSLRTASTKNGFRLPMIGWIGASAAAAVVVGVVGATMDSVVSGKNPLASARAQVLVAKKDIPQWTPIKNPEELFERREAQQSDAPAGSISDLNELKDRVVLKDIEVGKPITISELQDKSKVGLEGFLAPKTRGIAITVDPNTVAGGFVQPGSKVDVIQQGATVLQDVPVRALDDQTGADNRRPTVTVEVSPEQAAKLLKARESGNVSLQLRRDYSGIINGNVDQPVDKMAENLGEKHLSDLGKSKGVTINSDGRTPYASVKDGTSNTIMLGEKFMREAGRAPLSSADGDSGAPVELKTPALRESNAPAQTYTYHNDQPAATPPAPPGWGYGMDGMGGMGGGGGSLGNITGARSSSAAGAKAGKSDNTYFRPGEQAAAELGNNKDDKASKSEAGQGQGLGEGKPAAAPAQPLPGKVNINTIDDESTRVALGTILQKEPKIEKAAPAGMRKIIIRTGDIEFEVDSFDSAVATVTLLVNKLPGAFVATVNSEKLPNGKVRGSMVVRTPPEHLDTLVLDLRKELGKNGELKGQKIGSQDITKQYTDTESRLKAARAMENRLLEIIKTGKGEIKDLLIAEKELGVWRTKIEEYEGEKRYYDNQVALSTLTIALAEKEIRSPFALIETERVQMGVEVEDVIKAQQAALKAIDDAKGRVTKSELKQHAADQLTATINFELPPDKAGPMRDRIEQLGRRTRLDVDRLQESEGGTGKPGEIKTRRKDTQFFLNLYNVANVAPRETVNLNLACIDTEDAYKKILARVTQATGRIVSSNLNRQRNDQTTGQVQFEVKSADAEAVLLDVREQGEVMRLQTTENPDLQNTTRSKRGFIVQLFALGTVAPRETATIQLASKDVPAGYRSLLDAVAKAKGRVLNSQLNEQDKQNITANLDFEIRRPEEAAITKALAAVGDTYSSTVARAQDSDTVVDSKVRYTVNLINQARIPARETVTLGIEVNDVDKTATDFTAHAAAARGRTVESHVARERSGRMTAKLIYDVPLASAPDLVEKFSRAGIVRVQQFSKNQQVPESDLAIARLDVTLSNSPLIVPSDEGFGTELRKGLATSVKVLSLSLSWLVFGLMVILPWAVVVYAIYRLVVRLRGKPSPA